MADKYTFSPTTKRHWYCSKKKAGCQARVFLNDDETEVLFYNKEHNHEPPLFMQLPSGLYFKLGAFQFLTIVRGHKQSRILLYKKHTFVSMGNGKRWYCSKKTAGCKARVDIAGDFVTEVDLHHTHPPPCLYERPDGTVIKLRT
ncbi:unnamed protein product [Leptosia nina]|uniref:FLYWCH-type domain-containing protein n=1 Tax=Leptosia nina TaxID=320188 RepID=A0AAV1J3A7_9NEOP